MTGAEIILCVLEEMEVDTVFGYPGGSVLSLYDALYSKKSIRHILTAHEQGAAFAADGYARTTGKTGVCFATSGPGATNLTTGIAAAYMDSSPIVAITGNVPLHLLGTDSFQEVDIVGITMPITKYGFIVKDTNELADTVREAFKIAQSGRKGSVLVDVPKDILEGTCDYTVSNPMSAHLIPSKKPLPPEYLERAANMINKSKRPLLFTGGGVIHSNASANLTRFAKKLDCPVCSSLMGLGGFPGDDPLFLGTAGMHGSENSDKAIKNADLIIVAGARFSERTAQNGEGFAPNAKILQIDIDLAEIDKNVSTNLYLSGDLDAALSSLIDLTDEKSNPEWTSFVKADKQTATDGYSPEFIIKELAKITSENDIISTDVGLHQMTAAGCYPFRKPRRLATSGGLGAMGFGLGAAIGAQLGNPDSKVILVTGDGSFRMNFNELTTLSALNLPIMILLFNNRSLGMVKQWQKDAYNERYSQTDLPQTVDYIKLAQSFGIETAEIDEGSDVGSVLMEAYGKNTPVFINCILD